MTRETYIPILAQKIKEKLSYCDLNDSESGEIAKSLIGFGVEGFSEDDYPGSNKSSPEFEYYWTFFEHLNLLDICRDLQLEKRKLKAVLRYSTVENLISNIQFLKDIHFLKSGVIWKSGKIPSKEYAIIKKIYEEIANKTATKPIEINWFIQLLKEQDVFNPFNTSIDRDYLNSTLDKILLFYFFKTISPHEQEAWFVNAYDFFKIANQFGKRIVNADGAPTPEDTSLFALLSLLDRNNILFPVSDLLKHYNIAQSKTVEFKIHLQKQISGNLNITSGLFPEIFVFNDQMLEIVHLKSGLSYKFAPIGFRAVKQLYNNWKKNPSIRYKLSDLELNISSNTRMNTFFDNEERQAFRQAYLINEGPYWSFRSPDIL